MKNIVIFCGAGMSSSLLVTKGREAAKKANLECNINAYSLMLAESKAKDADCILVGPQVRLSVPKLKTQFPDKPIEVIDSEAYGLMNGMAVLKQAVRLIKQAKKAE